MIQDQVSVRELRANDRFTIGDITITMAKLNHPDTVLAEHLQIEARLAAGNPPEVMERASQTRAALNNFKEWLARRDRADGGDSATAPESTRGPTFHQWLAEQEAQSAEGP